MTAFRIGRARPPYLSATGGPVGFSASGSANRRTATGETGVSASGELVRHIVGPITMPPTFVLPADFSAIASFTAAGGRVPGSAQFNADAVFEAAGHKVALAAPTFDAEAEFTVAGSPVGEPIAAPTDHGDAASGVVSSNSVATIAGLSSDGPDTFIFLNGAISPAATLQISSVTFGGNAATQLVFQRNDDNTQFSAIYHIAGSQTGNIVVTADGSYTWIVSATVISIDNLQSSTPVDTDTAKSDSATALSLSALASPGTGGIRLVAFVYGDDDLVTPTNAVELADIDPGDPADVYQHWAGYDLGDDGTTITCTSVGGAEQCAMVGVSLR